MSIIFEEPELEIIQSTIPYYNVIIENDEFHTFPFVISVLIKVFSFDKQQAVITTNKIHAEGGAIVWTGTKEVAELKVEQVSSIKEGNLGSINCYIQQV